MDFSNCWCVPFSLLPLSMIFKWMGTFPLGVSGDTWYIGTKKGEFLTHLYMFSTSILAQKRETIWGCHAQAWNLNKKLIAACSNSQDYSTRFWSRARPGDSNFEQFLPKRVGVPLPCLEKRNTFPEGSMGLVYLPSFYHKNQPFM